MQYSAYKIQYLTEMTQYFIAWSNRWFFVVWAENEKNVSSDIWRLDNRRYTVIK